MLKKFMFVGSYGILAGFTLIYRESLVHWMSSDSVWYQDVLIGFVGLLIAIIPAIPYSIVAAVFGAKYGAEAGSLINLPFFLLDCSPLFPRSS